jgi:hypothetical protein
MDLAGVLIIADAAHTVKANCRQITQMKGGDYLFFLKGNQPLAQLGKLGGGGGGNGWISRDLVKRSALQPR